MLLATPSGKAFWFACIVSAMIFIAFSALPVILETLIP
jgi:hypothetical protein